MATETETVMAFSLSIRQKITYGFGLLLVFMIGTALLTYGLVRRVEKKVLFVEVMDDFFNATLEARRFEKNYFLYGQEKDLRENLFYWQKLVDLLGSNPEAFDAVIPSGGLSGLRGMVGEYHSTMLLLHQYVIASPAPKEDLKRQRLEERIRSIGKSLTDVAEQTSLAERHAIRSLLQTTRNILIASIFALLGLAIVITTLLGSNVVRSLKVLEDYTRRISRGERKEADIKVHDQEIVSLLSAFNRMLHELKLRQQQLVQSEKLAALGTLLSGVAHELNNPLSNISTSAQILSEEIEENDLEFKKSLITQIEQQADKARDIVRSLLEFSRVREFSKQKLPLAKLLAETVLLIRGQVPSRVDVAIDVADDLEIIADKQRIQQVFLNLIKNAVDVVGDNGHIWISARQTGNQGRGKEVEILVEDDGPGIETENLKRIFDPFFTTKDVGKGSGLGLFIVHDIIQWHGGTITVDSRPGIGTTFIIWLPGGQEDTHE